MTAPQQTPESFLMGGGGKSAKFETVGASITGTVTSQEMRQQTDPATSKPKFWDNGDPQMQLVVRLQTDQRDDAEDDGIRAIYVKGGFKAPTMQKAVADAIRAAGATGLAVGGQLTITYVGDGPRSAGLSAPKYYSASYAPPAAGFLQQPQAVPPPAQAAPPVQAAPAYVPPAAAPAAPVQQVPAPTAAPAAPALVSVQLADGSTQQVTPEIANLLQATGGLAATG